jgi:integrase
MSQLKTRGTIRANQREVGVRKASHKKKYLEQKEIDELIHAASARGRHQHRDSTLILMMFRHGLRACEASNLQWSDISWHEATIYIWRAKNGIDTTHKLLADELEALSELKRLYPDSLYVFNGEGTSQLSTESVARIVKSAGELAKLSNVHPHTLRHSCGFALANKGYTTRDIQEFLGHTNIQNTVIYTSISAKRLENVNPVF